MERGDSINTLVKVSKRAWPGLMAGIFWALNLPTGDYWLKEFNKLASISSGCVEKIHTIYRNNQILLGG